MSNLGTERTTVCGNLAENAGEFRGPIGAPGELRGRIGRIRSARAAPSCSSNSESEPSIVAMATYAKDKRVQFYDPVQ